MKRKVLIIKIFKKMLGYYTVLGDVFRARAYRNALVALDNDTLGSIGKSLKEKIKEIQDTGHLSALEDLEKTPMIKAYTELEKVSGLGPKQIKTLIETQGIKGFADFKRRVLKGEIEVSRQQMLGIKYYDDLQKKVPRAEIKELSRYIFSIITGTAHAVRATAHAREDAVSMDETDARPLGTLQRDIVGSYRRGTKESSDIDVLIGTQVHSPTATSGVVPSANFIDALHKNFTQSPIYVDYIVKGATRYTLLVRLNARKPVRQLDIRYIPLVSYPAGLLYFTGSKDFNTSMRQYAKKKGYLLNEYGLYRIRGVQRTQERVDTKTEKDIFEALGLHYIAPSKRTFFSAK